MTVLLRDREVTTRKNQKTVTVKKLDLSASQVSEFGWKAKE